MIALILAIILIIMTTFILFSTDNFFNIILSVLLISIIGYILKTKY